MAKELRFGEEARRPAPGRRRPARRGRQEPRSAPRAATSSSRRSPARPEVTNDGVTIAREIHLRDPFENMGAQLLKEAAVKTNDTVGDGTTTATVLAQAIVREGMKAITSGGNPVLVKRGHRPRRGRDRRAPVVASRTPCRPLEDLSRVAAISANDDERSGASSPQTLHTVGDDGVDHRRRRPGARASRVELRRGLRVRQRLRLARTWSPTRAAARRSSTTRTCCSRPRRSPTSARSCRCSTRIMRATRGRW